MKTYGDLYPQIYDFDNIHLAYLKARKSKRYKYEVMQFSAHLEENLINIQNHLIWKSYRPSPYKYFTIMSWIGHAMHADSYRLREKVLGGLVFVKNKAA